MPCTVTVASTTLQQKFKITALQTHHKTQRIKPATYTITYTNNKKVSSQVSLTEMLNF